jgi:hypothetical protein
MKKLIISIIVTFIIHVSTIFAGVSNTAYGEVISEEYNIVNGTFNFTIEYKFIDTVTFAYNKSTQFILPDGWSANIAPVIKGNVYYPEDTILLTVTVNYPVNNLPFYPKKISIIQFVTSDNTIEKEISTSAMVYFTPYNTIEIWNLQDFQNLPRRWFTPIENPDTTRIYIDPSNIPESNIDTSVYINWEIGDWEDDWQDEYREVKMQGLSYAVLMKPVPPDSVDYYKSIGDGPDSTNISGEKSKIFTGVVYGHLYTKINNDLGNPALVALTGIKVKLMDQDKLWAETIETTYTDNHGYFEIHYSTNQIFEGEKMELFLRFKSRTNNDYQIHSTNLIGSNYKVNSQQISVPQNAEWNQIETILAYDESNYYDAFRTVHWANNGFRYFEAENIPLGKRLTIHINTDEVPFITGSFYMLGNIFLTDLAGDKENTPYHEFGHYTMYKLQSNNFTYPYGENGCADHSWSKENTSNLAWVEGWADAVQMILDAAYWQEDREYGLKGGDLPLFEVRKHYNSCNINNGFRSEYYIACAIYDLWDGPNRNLPNLIPDNPNNPNYTFTIHGWNDSGQGIYGWKSEDDIELSFYNICKPLVDHPTGMQGYIAGDKCMNIHDYYRYLVDNISDCDLKADISRVFRENRIQWNIAEYEWTWNVTNLSSDFIKQTEIKDESGYIILGGFLNSRNWTDNYLVNFYNKNSFNEFRYSAYATQDLIISDNLWLGIWDTYSNVYKRSDLYLNDAVRYDYLGNPSEIHGNYQTCGGIEIDLKYGKLELGGGGKVNTTANLIINDKSLLRFRNNSNLNILTGSSIIIKEGGTLYIENNADIVLHDNAKIIVEPGGYICIEEGANISDLSKIELQQGYNIGINPVLNISHDNCYTIECGTLVYYTHPDKTIVDINDTWNNENFKFRKNLVIQSGTELTINNSYLEFEEKAKIIVEPGSKLILNNTKVTNLEQCGTMWQGIEVWGNKDLSQYPESNQGVVELKNGAIIENALNAIRTIKSLGDIDDDGNEDFDWAYTGGIIHAKDANFINNRKAIEFLSYHNILPNGSEIANSSYFYNCTFETNAQLSDPGTLPETFVSLYDVKGVKFFGCTFQNTAPTGVYSTTKRGNGITSVDASYEVKPLCLNPYIYPCTEYQPNTFQNLYYGIDASNTNPAITLTINGNNFDNNHRSIILKGINNATITKNNFDIGASIGNDIKELPNEGEVCELLKPSYGIYLHKCSGYKVEENNFSTTHNGRAGIIVDNSGINANEIYNNTFDNLAIGTQAQGVNAAGVWIVSKSSNLEDIEINVGQGLQFLCNQYFNVSS